MELKNYHHGDLKNELIYKGIYLLAKEGYKGFTIRRLAEFCNVSHTAPYKHFKNKEGLIHAISEKIAEEFSKSLEKSLNVSDDKRYSLILMGKQYVEFMTENPEYFRFIFMTDHGRPIDFSNSDLSGNKPLSIALMAAKSYYDTADIQGTDFITFFMEIWSMLQGYSLMLISNTIKKDVHYLKTVEKLLTDFLDKKTPR